MKVLVFNLPNYFPPRYLNNLFLQVDHVWGLVLLKKFASTTSCKMFLNKKWLQPKFTLAKQNSLPLMAYVEIRIKMRKQEQNSHQLSCWMKGWSNTEGSVYMAESLLLLSICVSLQLSCFFAAPVYKHHSLWFPYPVKS